MLTASNDAVVAQFTHLLTDARLDVTAVPPAASVIELGAVLGARDDILKLLDRAVLSQLSTPRRTRGFEMLLHEVDCEDAADRILCASDHGLPPHVAVELLGVLAAAPSHRTRRGLAALSRHARVFDRMIERPTLSGLAACMTAAAWTIATDLARTLAATERLPLDTAVGVVGHWLCGARELHLGAPVRVPSAWAHVSNDSSERLDLLPVPLRSPALRAHLDRLLGSEGRWAVQSRLWSRASDLSVVHAAAVALDWAELGVQHFTSAEIAEAALAAASVGRDAPPPRPVPGMATRWGRFAPADWRWTQLAKDYLELAGMSGGTRGMPACRLAAALGSTCVPPWLLRRMARADAWAPAGERTLLRGLARECADYGALQDPSEAWAGELAFGDAPVWLDGKRFDGRVWINLQEGRLTAACADLGERVQLAAESSIGLDGSMLRVEATTIWNGTRVAFRPPKPPPSPPRGL